MTIEDILPEGLSLKYRTIKENIKAIVMQITYQSNHTDI